MDTTDMKGILHGQVSEFAEKVAPIFKLLGWRWHDSDTPPTQDEIEQTLRRLIDGLGDNGCYSTGGLSVFYIEEESEIGISFEYRKSVFY